MSSMLARALMVMRSLSLRTHTFTLCVVAGTLLLCLGLFREPNTDVSYSTTSVKKEMDTASASNLTIDIEVASLALNSDTEEQKIQINELSLDEDKEDDSLNVSMEDYLEFSRLVEAEASSEDLYGKTLVANVIVNRIYSDIFPDTLSEVIHDEGQFDPVDNGYIDYVEPSHDAKCAAMRALKREGYSDGALYFQKSAVEKWGDKVFLMRYGNHSFYK